MFEHHIKKQYFGYTNHSLQKIFKEHNTSYQKNPTLIEAKQLKEQQTHQIKFPDSITVLHKTKALEKVQES